MNERKKKPKLAATFLGSKGKYGSTKSSSVQVLDATICKTHKLMEKIELRRKIKKEERGMQQHYCELMRRGRWAKLGSWP